MNIEEKFQYKVHSMDSLLGQWQEKEWWAANLQSGAYLRPLLGKTSS